MINKILIAYDGSESADHAYSFALDLAGKYQAELFVLTVARPPEFAEDVETEAVIETSRRHFAHVLQPLKTRVATESIESKFEVVVGHPAKQLLLYAERHGIDHIVVGHRGHSVFEHWLLGSVARQVIGHAPCAVTVVRK